MSKKDTPMVRQYKELKRQHPGCLLFFRLGDFYELFYEDAEIAAQALDLTLTHRGDTPMCGVPYHVRDQYLARLIQKGFHVAVCDQIEDPKSSKGLVKRAITRVVTPGTFSDSEYLDASSQNYLMGIWEEGNSLMISLVDYTVGLFRLHFYWVQDLQHIKSIIWKELLRNRPNQILVNEKIAQQEDFCEQVQLRFGKHLELYQPKIELLLDELPVSKEASLQLHHVLKEYQEFHPEKVINQLLSYLLTTQMSGLEHIRTFEVEEETRYLWLDDVAKKNLELFENLGSGKKEGSLLQVLDHCQTAMGSRMLRQWIDRPLRSKKEITHRLDLQEMFHSHPNLAEDISKALKPIIDLERLSVPIVTKSITPRQMLSLGKSLAQCEKIRERFLIEKEPLAFELGQAISSMRSLSEKILSSLVDEIPANIGEMRLIREGINPELDRLFEGKNTGQKWLLALEENEKKRTGIKNLRVKFNKILGYYIEVTNSQLNRVPEDYIRKQTLVGSERFFTIELKELEEKLLGSKEKALALQAQLLDDLRNEIFHAIHDIQAIASEIAHLDVILSLCLVAKRGNYVRPQFMDSPGLYIREGRHPMVESFVGDMIFVPNDTKMDPHQACVSIITGPNMAGKSTFMRQSALIVLMAHMGTYVPARSAQMGIFDRIFTRIGASDNLSAGESTFMVEMREVATILQEATKSSLIILDEVGRGTGTIDGLSIAQALLEKMCQENYMTLFATHFHQLTDLSYESGKIRNLAILTEETSDGIRFLHKIVEGAVNESFGIEVARLAGVREDVVQRAQVIFDNLNHEGSYTTSPEKREKRSSTDHDKESKSHDVFAEKILSISPDDLTPRQAHELLYELTELVRRIYG